MKIKYSFQMCFLILALSHVQGQGLNTSESRIDTDLTLPTLIQKLLKKKIDLAEATAFDDTTSRNLEIQIKDKKMKSSNLNLPSLPGYGNKYVAQNDLDGSEEVVVRSFALRYIIIAPGLCRKGYQKDNLGNCRRPL